MAANFFGPASYIWDNIFSQDKSQNKTPNSSATQPQYHHPTSDLDNIIDKLKVENDPYETLLMLEILGKQLIGETNFNKYEYEAFQRHKNHDEIQKQLIDLTSQNKESLLQKINDTSSAIESRYNLFFQDEQKDYAFENFKKNYEKSYRVLEKSFAKDAKPEDPKSLSKKKFLSLVNKYATNSDFIDPQRDNSDDKLTEFAFSLTVSHLLGRQKQTREDGEARQEAENKKSIPSASYWNPDFTIEEKKSTPSASYWNSDFTLTSIDSNFRSLASTSIAFFTPFVSSINKIFPTPDSQTQFQQNNATPAVQKSNELNTNSSSLSQASTNFASSQNLNQTPPATNPEIATYSLALKSVTSVIFGVSNFFQSLIPQTQQNKESPAQQENTSKKVFEKLCKVRTAGKYAKAPLLKVANEAENGLDKKTTEELQRPLNNFLAKIRNETPPNGNKKTSSIPRGWLKGIENGEVAIFAVKNNNVTPQKPTEKPQNTKEGKENISPPTSPTLLKKIQHGDSFSDRLGKRLKIKPSKKQNLLKGQKPTRSNYR